MVTRRDLLRMGIIGAGGFVTLLRFVTRPKSEAAKRVRV